MKLVSTVAISAMFACAISGASYAQSKCAAIKPSSSSGLTLAITRILAQKDVTIQFIISNTTNGRVYLKSAHWGDNAKAFLSSGAQLNPPVATSIESTEGFIGSTCVSNPGCSQNLDKFSYIEANDSLPFSFKYYTPSPVAKDDTISFTVVMVARFSKATDAPDQAGGPRLVRFSFNSVPLGC